MDGRQFNLFFYRILAIFNISYHIAYNILFTILMFMYIAILGGAIGWWRIYLCRNSLHTDGGTVGWTDNSLIFSSIGSIGFNCYPISIFDIEQLSSFTNSISQMSQSMGIDTDLLQLNSILYGYLKSKTCIQFYMVEFPSTILGFGHQQNFDSIR
jgi:hypothetical protein